MATVEPGYASWLTLPARYVSTAIAGAASAWAGLAEDSSIISPLALKADAQTVATSQAQILAGPNARDQLTIAGLHADKIGTVINVTADRAGYENGANVFVVGAQEADEGKVTTLTVIKRL